MSGAPSCFEHSDFWSSKAACGSLIPRYIFSRKGDCNAACGVWPLFSAYLRWTIHGRKDKAFFSLHIAWPALCRWRTDDQAMMFMAGANSIFTGDQLLTTANPEFDADKVKKALTSCVILFLA